MNVIFLDFDGVVNTYHDKDLEGRIKVLAEICKKYSCKVVISAAARKNISEKTLTSHVGWVNNILQLMKKYNIECIGRTKVIKKKSDNGFYYDMCKEAEIIHYLISHPEIKHFCIIDDEDLTKEPDTGKLRDYIVTPVFYSVNPDEEGLLPTHINEVGMILKKKNIFRKEE